MAFERRVCVLRQVRKGFSADGSALTGAVYAERLGTELTVTPRIAALSSLKEGRYALFVWVDANIYCLELKGGAPLRIENAPSLSAGFAALLCFVRGEPEPVAYGRCGAAPERYSALLEEAPARKRPIPVPNPPIQTPAPAPNVPLAPTVPLPEPTPEPSPHEGRAAARYDDEAIAASDYFAGTGDGDEKTAPAAEGAHGAAAPGDAGDLLLRPRGSLTYYYEVRERLVKAFAEGEKDERLLAVFPRSEWVRRGGALLGVVYEEGIPRWLCVAAAAAEGDPPPEAMGGHAVFVPQTHFSQKEGFWVVFQDADTGEYGKVGES